MEDRKLDRTAAVDSKPVPARWRSMASISTSAQGFPIRHATLWPTVVGNLCASSATTMILVSSHCKLNVVFQSNDCDFRNFQASLTQMYYVSRTRSLRGNGLKGIDAANHHSAEASSRVWPIGNWFLVPVASCPFRLRWI